MSVPFHVNVCLSSRRAFLARLTRGSPTWGKTFFPNARVEQSFSLVRKEELALRAESHATLLVCRKRRLGFHEHRRIKSLSCGTASSTHLCKVYLNKWETNDPCSPCIDSIMCRQDSGIQSAHPSSTAIKRARRRHYLFGYPIAHSASPSFQNAIIQNIDHDPTCTPTYSLCETQNVNEQHMYQLVRRDVRHGGSGITMPLKVAVAKNLGPDYILDDLDDIGRATMTVNTIVVLPGEDGCTSVESRRMIGTNTDCLGIRHALLRDIAVQNGCAPGDYIGHSQSEGPYVFPLANTSLPHSAFIIGGGGTCRSAVWALHNLGLSPLYLLNRDESETQEVVEHFKPLGIDLRPIHSLQACSEERRLREAGNVGPIAAAVGAIPAVEPETHGEKMVSVLSDKLRNQFTISFRQVYTLAHSFLCEDYSAFTDQTKPAVHSLTPSIPSKYNNSSTLRTFPLPPKRPFLDMCYKPRMTPLLQYAMTKAPSWSPIGGVEAMVEQGLAQARVWAASECILAGQLPQVHPLQYAVKQGDQGPLGVECEEKARKLVQQMTDVTTTTFSPFPLEIPPDAMVANRILTTPQQVH